MADIFFAFTLGTAERRTTIAVMVIVCAALVLPLIGCLIAYFAAGQTIALLIGVVVFADLPLLFVLAGYAPKGAVVTREDLRIVRRKHAPVVLPAQQIVSLERIEASVLRGCIRTFGVGGFLGSWGRFRCKQLGAFRAYMTNTKSLVLIRTVSQGLFVISPDSPEEFVARATEAFGLSPSINPSV
ncbi:MAG: PH domain-containing protein [Candidatus Hydrogenedentes bacterium]|nr:PH domain-containing protein [Candidatus Hydrogenedentota bacterium]